MRFLAAARFAGALAVGLWVIGSTVHAGGGHEHDHAHGPSKTAKTVASVAPSVTATSETFELVGELRDGRLVIRLSDNSNGAAVRDARVEVGVDGETVVAAPQPDGTYLLATPALAKPGDHEIIATITASTTSDLLVGTLTAGSHADGESFDHDHASHHREAATASRFVELAQRPLVMGGSALALLAIGIGIGLRIQGRTSPFAKPLMAGALAVAAALVAGGMVYAPPGTSATSIAPDAKPGHVHGSGHKHGDGAAEGVIEMPAERIAAAQIVITTASGGALARRMTVPGVVVPDSGKLVRVPAQVVGTVAEMRKRIGDPVMRGEVIAIISSREVADAKSEYLAAIVNLDLQQTLYERSQALWEKRVTPEQQFLQVKASYTQAELRADLARQKLSSLGLDAKTVAQEAKEDGNSQGPSRLRTYEVRSPITGRVVERKVDVGAPVGKEGDASELYSIADLSAVWVEMAVPLADLDGIKEGQKVTVKSDQKSSEGRIVFVSPVVNAETRSARVIAQLDNKELTWRPGTFVTAEIVFDETQISVRIPRSALQTIEGKQVVFVRTRKGFEKREVSLGKGDEDAVEVIGGLAAGEAVAVGNTFLLKADLGKAEAEHSH